MSDKEVIEDANQKDDEELMQNLILSIEELKREKPTAYDSQEEEVEEHEENDPLPEIIDLENDPTQPQKTDDLDNMSLSQLRELLSRVKDAMNFNNLLQGILLMKEVKLLSIKRQITSSKSEPQNKQKEDQKTDVGRYYVRFKAPYFKNIHNFAGYVIVPENQLPATAQRYETQAGQWNKTALKDLEFHVRQFLARKKSGDIMMANKPKTIAEKERIISTYNFMRKHAPMATLVDQDFDNIIDWCSVASKLKKDFSPNECQKAWNIFLRPDINKKKWTVAEKENLKRVALEHNYEDWDTIALELGTNRTGYQCFHLYVDKIMKLVEGDWSVAEEDFLTKLVKECTYGEKIMWHKVAYFFETRTITQIYRKWTLSCVGKEVVAGAFTEEEDRTIIEMLIVRKGEFSIAQVAKKLNRISSQIRYRFAQLKSSLKHKYGEWSLEEDKLLLDLVARFGKKSWSTIADHMPDRGRVQIRHRYTNIRKRLAANPNLSLETLNRFKRPVHSKRKETNLKCLMELTGMEEQPADKSTNEGAGTSVQVEQIIGPDRKRRKKKPLEPKANLSPCRYPDLDEDGIPIQIDDDVELNIPEVPLSLDEPDRDPLELRSPEPPVKKAGKSTARTSRSTCKRNVSNSEPQADLEPNEEEQERDLKHRQNDLYSPIVEYYTTNSDFVGHLVKPPQGQGPRKRSKAETLNSILKFTPYKYFDPKNADWTYDADITDPYYKQVFEMIEKKSDSDDQDSEEDEKVSDDRLLPPCLTNFGGFYNLLVDMGISEENLDISDDRLDTELKKLYCEDEETVGAVCRWHKRLSTLFAWPAALSGVSLVMEDAIDADSDAGEDVGPTTSEGLSKSKPNRLDVVKIEPICDDECTRLSHLDLTDGGN